MRDKQINKEAFQQAEDQLKKEKIDLIKGYITSNLKAQERNRKEDARIQEEYRVLKKDLEDLKAGNFDKIEERIAKSPAAQRLASKVFNGAYKPFSTLPDSWNLVKVEWPRVTSGTYQTGAKIYYF